MRKFALLALVAAFCLSAGCAYRGSSTNLKQVAADAKMINITTGDGTFENYQAIGQYKGTEIGIAVGVPGFKKRELFPVQSNEELLLLVAKSAADDGANAMINVIPHTETYWGIPFFFVGIYIDKASGTGIKTK